MPTNDSAFWQFSLQLYARAEVPPLCLALQDRHGVDVNLLFFLLFLAQEKRRLSHAEVQRMEQSTAAWRVQAVQPLRKLRRDLKNGVASMESQASEALRTEIKRCELHAERLQQEMLERAFPAASVGAPCSVNDAAEANIAAYGTVLGATNGALPNDLVQPLLKSFADASSKH